MTFENVLPLIKKGEKALRSGWNGKNLVVYLITKEVATKALGNALDREVGAYFVIEDNNKKTINTWVPSVSDLVAEDWLIK